MAAEVDRRPGDDRNQLPCWCSPVSLQFQRASSGLKGEHGARAV